MREGWRGVSKALGQAQIQTEDATGGFLLPGSDGSLTYMERILRGEECVWEQQRECNLWTDILDPKRFGDWKKPPRKDRSTRLVPEQLYRSRTGRLSPFSRVFWIISRYVGGQGACPIFAEGAMLRPRLVAELEPHRMSNGHLQPAGKGSNRRRKRWKIQARAKFSSDRKDHPLSPSKVYSKDALSGNLLIHK